MLLQSHYFPKRLPAWPSAPLPQHHRIQRHTDQDRVSSHRFSSSWSEQCSLGHRFNSSWSQHCFLLHELPTARHQFAHSGLQGQNRTVRHTSHIARHTSHVTRHTSLLTRHLTQLQYSVNRLFFLSNSPPRRHSALGHVCRRKGRQSHHSVRIAHATICLLLRSSASSSRVALFPSILLTSPAFFSNLFFVSFRI